ncbi:hypothetical protein DSM112329_01078 [Paraconexibacter sp. AEG42_29]|uniref:UBP-type domain-containing protein n=1 Tax=Paraconexibacter sp. AEG42_29 TaxID=2997339 RepID=A0AAU7ARI1_9ACTN
MAATCTHLDTIEHTEGRGDDAGCPDCLAVGGTWVHLRRCTACGRVGCCDSSPNTHATKHHAATGHPVIRSIEPGEQWLYCYPDDIAFTVDGVQ